MTSFIRLSISNLRLLKKKNKLLKKLISHVHLTNPPLSVVLVLGKSGGLDASANESIFYSGQAPYICSPISRL